MTGFGWRARARKWAWRGLLVSLATFGIVQIGSGLCIYAKAAVAEELLERARGNTPEDGATHEAWTWADTWPVARLAFPKYGVDLVVLEAAGSKALAFGPGRMSAFARPGGPNTAIIAAHRDTRFSFLEKVQTGDEFWVETKDGSRHHYAVVDTMVLDSRNASFHSDPGHSDPGGSLLVLLTCYPLDSFSAGRPLRTLVFAEATGSV